MKALFKLMIGLLFMNGLNAQRKDIKFIFDGHLRESIIMIPQHAPPPSGYPIVMVLHSSAHNAEEPFNVFGWKELGETENFISIYPTALKWCVSEGGAEKIITRWVNGGVTEYPCSGPPQNYVDDIKFFKQLIKIIKDTLPVDASKIFITGFSNGCVMTQKVAMQAGDVFAAAAGSGGILAKSDSILNPVKRIPLWFMVGTKDDMFIVPPFSELPFYGDSILLYFKGVINRTLACQALSPDYIHNESPITQTYVFNKSQSGGSSASPYIFTLVKNMRHQYPNGVNYPLEGAKLFWNFFKQSSTATKEHLKEHHVSIYPNPSFDQISIQVDDDYMTSSYELNVLNCYGQTIYHEQEVQKELMILDKRVLGTGVFLVQVKNEKWQEFVKVIVH